MSFPQQVIAPGQRLNELLEAIKQEFDSVTNEASVYRLHKDEFDVKVNQQTSDLGQIRQSVYELEMAHRKMKERYEEEIMRLKSELEAR
ncbi:general corepressor Tup1p, partial [Yarrowia lipolytica]